jgi:26S proteasome regulatory subunit T3
MSCSQEVKWIQSVPLINGQFMEMVNGNNAIIESTIESKYYVRILSTINRGLFKPTLSSVELHHHSNVLVDMLPPKANSSISLVELTEKPNML